MAGTSDFKTILPSTSGFDPRLKEKIVRSIDIYYGGENGFSQTLDLCKDLLDSVKFVQEQKIISKYFEEINSDPDKIVYGAKATMEALESGAIDTLVVFENLPLLRVNLQNPTTMGEHAEYIPPSKLGKKVFKEKESGLEMEHISDTPLVEWIAENYTSFNANLVFITDKSPEGFQFVHGFGGIGAFLR